MDAKLRRRTHCFAALSIVIAVFTLVSTSHAALIFYGDFSDGDHLDGSPVSWGNTGPDPDDEEMVVDGSLVITSGGINLGYNWAAVDLDLADVSIRAQGRGGNPNDVLAAAVRSDGAYDNYYVRVGHAEGWDTGVLGLAGLSGGDRIWIPTDLQPYEEDVVMQLDAFGNQLSVWAWRPGEDMPDVPLITTTDNRWTSGWFGVGVWNNPWIEAPVEASFRDVLVADHHIPPPLAGDYNIDGVVDAADYVTWRDALGSVQSLPNDDTSGVGVDDYDRWRANFGTAVSVSSTTTNGQVPEPTTYALALAATLFFVGNRRGALAALRRPTCSGHINDRTLPAPTRPRFLAPNGALSRL